MFEAQTYDKVLEEILSRAPDGIDLRQGSIFYDAVAGIAFKIAKYYADLEQVFEMVFLVTATGDYLTLKAEEYAVYRQASRDGKVPHQVRRGTPGARDALLLQRPVFCAGAG